MRIVIAAAAVFAAVAAAGGTQRTQDGWQAFCVFDGDWFGPCRALSDHAFRDRDWHDEQEHDGERTADTTAACTLDVAPAPEREEGWQAFCVRGHEWFGSCRVLSDHAFRDRDRHNEQQHGGERAADTTAACVPPSGGR